MTTPTSSVPAMPPKNEAADFDFSNEVTKRDRDEQREQRLCGNKSVQQVHVLLSRRSGDVTFVSLQSPDMGPASIKAENREQTRRRLFDSRTRAFMFVRTAVGVVVAIDKLER